MILSLPQTMEEEHYIYLTNLGSKDVYETNSPSSFENRLNPPIQLNAEKEYEIGLVNCLYPKEFYGISKNDHSSRIELYATSHVNPDHPYLLHTYIPHTNIVSGDVRHLIDTLNREIPEDFREALKDKFTHFFPAFPGGTIFGWNSESERVYLGVTNGECFSDDHFCKLVIKFGSRMAEVLGFTSQDNYTVYDSSTPVEEATGKVFVPAPFLPRKDGGIDFVVIYADCVAPTRYGGQRVNILEAITMEGTGGRDFHQTTYKPLSKTYLDSIAIIVRDQKGRDIEFGRGKSLTLLVHIRPK